MSYDNTRTLTRHDYISDEIYEIERSRIFHGGWMLAARADRLQNGNRKVVELAGESVLITRDLDGTLHAFANVCRHRGARLCDANDDSRQGSLMCPYHAWTYALDGRLIATPFLEANEVDRSLLPLWSYHIRETQGFVFVSLAKDPPDFEHWLNKHCADMLRLARFNCGDLQVAATTTCEVKANWKIVIENYQECLHCARVHPELTAVVPVYRTGSVIDHTRSDGGVDIDGDFAMPGATDTSPPLPGISELDATSYYGGIVFPNGFIDISGTCVIVSTLFPKGPHHTTMTMEYMFAPETIASPDFDPTPTIHFNDLIAEQDGAVCERVHQGVSSRAFEQGVLTPKDSLVVEFTQHYLATRGPL